MTNLKKLINQAKNNQISWDTKVKLEYKLKVSKPLQTVSAKYWDKIKHVYPWWKGNDENDLLKQLAENNKLIKNSDHKFANKEILERFKNHVNTDRTLETKNRGTIKISDIDENDVIISEWSEIVKIIRLSWKIFGRNFETGALQNEESLLFLQAIVNEEICHTIEYQAGEEFELKEWNNAKIIEEESNAQKWLDQNYSQAKRTSLKRLIIRDQGVEGNLDLRDFISLEYLNCENNRLTSLNISGLTNLREVYCSDNQFTSENFHTGELTNVEYFSCRRNLLSDLGSLLNSLNLEKLVSLRIVSNNFSESDLSPFSKFTNLNCLEIGNYSLSSLLGKSRDTCNHFYGSLESLKDLKKLEKLFVNNTKIDNDWENLPDNLEDLWCEKTKLETEWEHFKKDLKKIKEFNGLASKWLDQNYPENSECQRETSNKNRDDTYGWNNKGKKRAAITHLDISKQELEGGLRLKGFTNLSHLICSRNQLTDLDLSDCKNLTTLKCDNNQLNALNFSTSLTNLIELDLSDCPCQGGLKSLEKSDKLELIRITNTNIEEGLEYLSPICKKLYCNSSYKYKSIKIIKELDKSKCSEEDKNGNRYYNIDKWREDKQNNAIASVTPLERFFVIRSNIRKFVDKWGMKEKTKEDNSQWYTNYFNYAKVPYSKFSKLEENNLTELNNLQSPEQFNKHWYWTVPQWAGRGAVGVSGVLSFFYDYQIGAIAVASPIIETVTSYAKKNYYDAKEKQWNEFAQDAKELLDNYHELLGILTMIKSNGIGQLSKTLIRLEKTVKEFLNEYDNNHNGTIDIFELQKSKEKLAHDLNKESSWAGGSKLERMVRLMKKLEEDINDYGQGKLSEETSLDNKKQQLAWLIIDWLAEYSDQDFDAEKMYNIKGKEGNYWREKNGWIEYLKEITEENAKKHDFNLIQENLLHPLAEVVLEKLKNTNIQELLADHKKNEQKLTEFLKKIEDLCELCQKLDSEELSGAITLLKSKISEFSNYLTEYSASGKKEQVEIEIKEEKRKLDKIVELIKNLEEEVKTCHESLTKKENKNEEQQLEENQALIEVPLLSITAV